MEDRNFKGVIFDFDGVLADTEVLQFEKWNRVLERYGVKISKEEYISEYCGKSSRTEIPKLLLRRYPQILLDKETLVKQTQEVLQELFETSAKLMPGAIEALERISSKYKIAIASGETDSQLEMKLKSVGLTKYFPEKVRSTQEKAGKGKPDPAMYLLAVKQLGLAPKDCVAIEDTEVGVESAVRAGLFVIAMPNKWTVNQDFSKANRVILGGWREFLENPFPLEL